VPASQITDGQESQGFKAAMKVLKRGRIPAVTLAVGTAGRMLRDAHVPTQLLRVQFR
jgi:alkylation response protein AidB-like acyl-CoA dehydrogenase